MRKANLSPRLAHMSEGTIFSHVVAHVISPVGILHKSIAGRYRPVGVDDRPITARYRFMENVSWGSCLLSLLRMIAA